MSPSDADRAAVADLEDQPMDGQAPGPVRTYLLLDMAGDLYCLEMSCVRSVADVGRPTAVPGAPGPLLGVVNLGGRVVAIADLAAVLGRAPSPERTRTTALVLNPVGPEDAPLALVADVLEVVEIADQAIERPPSFGLGPRAALVKGVAHVAHQRLALVIDMDRLMALFEEGAAA